LGKIPLVPGMPVLVNQKFDIDGGIVNGSTGVLKRIRFFMDESGRRYLKSCIVEISDSMDRPLPHLMPHHVPILQDSTDLTFTHPH
ncbi:hypothetical protein GLOTRDRAFT_25196, partial [Gloeophyllum trabeum ATCC 11539]